MSSVFMQDMKEDLAEDAALTVQSPRQPMQEDRSPNEGVMMNAVEEADEFEPQTGDMDFIFDGMIEALRRRSIQNV